MRKIGLLLVLIIFAGTAHADPGKCIPRDPRDCTIVLTFDDGPKPDVLPELLAFLKKEKISGTFYILGWKASNRPELIRQIHAEGHLIANHTMNHETFEELVSRKFGKPKPNMTTEEKKEREARVREKVAALYLEDVERSAQVTQKILGYRPLFFRPPRWQITQELYCALENAGYLVQTKSSVIHDHLCPRRQEILRGIEANFRQGVPRTSRQEYKRYGELKEIERRDVNTTDYDFFEWYAKKGKRSFMKDGFEVWVKSQFKAMGLSLLRADLERISVGYEKNHEQAVVDLFTILVRGLIQKRESAGTNIHILAMHELKLTARALYSLVPELRKRGYRFENIAFVYGIPGCVGRDKYGSLHCSQQ